MPSAIVSRHRFTPQMTLTRGTALATLVAALVVTACSSTPTASDQLKSAAVDAGYSGAEASCFADQTLSEFPASDVVNADGTPPSPEVQQRVSQILASCRTNPSNPGTAPVETTVVGSSVASGSDDVAAFCKTGFDLAGTITAKSKIPADATIDFYRLWVDDLVIRSRVAKASAPAGPILDQTTATGDAIGRYEELLLVQDFKIGQVNVDADRRVAKFDEQSTLFVDVVKQQCGTDDTMLAQAADAEILRVNRRLEVDKSTAKVRVVNGKTNEISVKVPVAWSTEAESIEPATLTVATDVAAFGTDWSVPGVRIIGFEDGVIHPELIESLPANQACAERGEGTYSDGRGYEGQAAVFEGCPNGSVTVVAAVINTFTEDSAFIEIHLTGAPDDGETVNLVLNTFST